MLAQPDTDSHPPNPLKFTTEYQQEFFPQTHYEEKAFEIEMWKAYKINMEAGMLKFMV